VDPFPLENQTRTVHGIVTDEVRLAVTRVLSSLKASKVECPFCDDVIWTLVRKKRAPRRWNLDGTTHKCRQVTPLGFE
jgi:hypothetical protein